MSPAQIFYSKCILFHTNYFLSDKPSSGPFIVDLPYKDNFISIYLSSNEGDIVTVTN